MEAALVARAAVKKSEVETSPVKLKLLFMDVLVLNGRKHSEE